MGVRRIPLRLPRAAPVPPCPGSSSISPCVSPPSHSPDPSERVTDRATLLRLRNQAQKKSRSRARLQSFPWRHSPAPSKSSYCRRTKNFLQRIESGGPAIVSMIREDLIHVRVPFTRKIVFMLMQPSRKRISSLVGFP
ncbi:Uncharacterized protein DBV15_06287 [Temnothorax longispinosus]|uniref:Uncharacterized protein n=1 Tax=Temnothorax longispinosus TaxID=300112 RepID=A0A4S2KEE5_9HYME|nr:Uncharacterized protein DBV15_06287 [Temnothorax longispinosus]